MPRPLELFLACMALVVLAPLIAFALVVSWVALRAGPVFRQQRIGRGDEPFTIYKIRTLSPAVSTSLDKHQLAEVRIPPLCRLLRKYHVDELPQLVNVIDGSMSLVGPRPEMPHLVERMGDDQRLARRPLRPGMTGLWQVSVDAKGLMYEHPEYDIDYAAGRSSVLDVRIMASTVVVATKARSPLSRAECCELIGADAVAGNVADLGDVDRAGLS